MAVLVEAFSVIVRKEALERKFPGGLDGYQRQLPNGTYCADEQLCRVGFMADADAMAHARGLVSAGLQGPAAGPSPELAIVSAASGHLIPCEWLEVELRWYPCGGHQVGVMVAKLPGANVTQFSTPAGWRPKPMTLFSAEDLIATHELVKVDRTGAGSVETYRHRQTGDLIYIGRPDVVQAQARYSELTKELRAIEGMSALEGSEAAAAFLRRATQLVEDTAHTESGPLMLQGIAARRLRRWDVAEHAFRTVTELQPTFLSAWHDLTWALASLGLLDEAESTARHAITMAPDDPASLGNLASVLRDRGKLDDALVAITRALELQPADNINEMILDRIRNDRRKKIHTRGPR
jgi:hypothetical protein